MRHREFLRENEHRRALRGRRRTRFRPAAIAVLPAAESLAVQAFQETLLGFAAQRLGCPCCLPSVPLSPACVKRSPRFTPNAIHPKRRNGANSLKRLCRLRGPSDERAANA